MELGVKHDYLCNTTGFILCCVGSNQIFWSGMKNGKWSQEYANHAFFYMCAARIYLEKSFDMHHIHRWTNPSSSRLQPVKDESINFSSAAFFYHKLLFRSTPRWSGSSVSVKSGFENVSSHNISAVFFSIMTVRNICYSYDD